MGVLKDAHKKLWEMPQHRHYTKHGPEHAQRVRDSLDACFGPYVQLNETESFVLEASVYLHDIGMQCSSADLLETVAGVTPSSAYGYDDLDRVRRVHHKLSRAMVDQLLGPARSDCWCRMDASEVWHELSAVALLCAGHAVPASELPVELPEIRADYADLPEETNLLCLLYLLRIGDAMDAARGRVHTAHAEKMWQQLAEIDRYHCWKHWFVSSVHIQGAGLILFRYSIPPSALGWCDVIGTCAEHRLQDNLRRFGNQLRSWGVIKPSVNREFRGAPAQDLWSRHCPLNLREFAREAQRVSPDAFSSSALLDDPRKVYVPLRCAQNGLPESRDVSIQVSDLIERVICSLRLGAIPVVFGACGEGKTFFAKRLAFDTATSLRTEVGLRPLVVSLKGFRQGTQRNETVFHRIRAAVKRAGVHALPPEPMEQPRPEEGGMLLIFDGLDEVPFVNREGAVQQVLEDCRAARKGNGIITNAIVVTSRGGVIGARMDDPFVPFVIDTWTPEDFAAYVALCKQVLPQDLPESLIPAVRSRDVLAKLARLPLYAKMIVHVAHEVCSQPPEDTGPFWLLSRFVDAAFSSRRSRLTNEQKETLLKRISFRMFRNGLTMLPGTDFAEVYADMVLPTLTPDALVAEVGALSLMHYGEDGICFNHPPLHDYFLVKALVDFWHDNRPRMLTTLGSPQPLTRTAVNLLAENFRDTRGRLSAFLRSEFERTAPRRRIAANAFLILHVIGETLPRVQRADFSSFDLTGLSFAEIEFSDCKFRRTDLSNAEFERCRFLSCPIEAPVLSSSKFRECDFATSKIAGLQPTPVGGSPPEFVSCNFGNSADPASSELLRQWEAPPRPPPAGFVGY